MTNYKL